MKIKVKKKLDKKKTFLKQNSKKNISELNGPKGPEPTRFGDWERKGITSDF